jgi:glycosyltransferase involved in cell wall biosynthesis
MTALVQEGGDGTLPFLTVIMPVYNEEKYIAESLGSVLAQDYPPERMEIVVADGMSTDGTRAIVAGIQRDHPQVRLVDNPERIVPTGLNRAIAAARGDIIVRMDGHAVFAADFLRRDVEILQAHPEVWSAGGPIVHDARTPFGKAAALAMSHPVGVGNAAHRFADYEGYAEGAAFPALHRWVFDRAGMFDENLVRNQDDEFNYRIHLAGGKIYVSPRVHYRYFVRETAGGLFRQYFQYSFWRIPVIRKHRKPTTGRQLLPTLFFGLMGVLAVAGAASANAWVALTLPVLYAVAVAAIGLASGMRAGAAIAVRVPLAIATLHSAYAAGMAYGFLCLATGHDAWRRNEKMSRISR